MEGEGSGWVVAHRRWVPGELGGAAEGSVVSGVREQVRATESDQEATKEAGRGELGTVL